MAEYRADHDLSLEGRDEYGSVRATALLVLAFTIILGAFFAYGLLNKYERQASASRTFDVRIVGRTMPGIVVKPNKALVTAMANPVHVSAPDASSGIGGTDKSIQP